MCLTGLDLKRLIRITTQYEICIKATQPTLNENISPCSSTLYLYTLINAVMAYGSIRMSYRVLRYAEPLLSQDRIPHAISKPITGFTEPLSIGYEKHANISEKVCGVVVPVLPFSLPTSSDYTHVNVKAIRKFGKTGFVLRGSSSSVVQAGPELQLHCTYLGTYSVHARRILICSLQESVSDLSTYYANSRTGFHFQKD